jgi:stage II sporulation protein E
MTRHEKTLKNNGQAQIESGNGVNKYTVLRELLFGAAYLGIAFLLGNCKLPFSSFPLGLALLCASSAHSWYILSGLLLSAVTTQAEQPVWIPFTVYAVCLLLRIGMLYFVDTPHGKREDTRTPANRDTWQVKRDVNYLGHCWRAFAKLFTPNSSTVAADDIREDYYPGAMFAKDPPAERDNSSDEDVHEPPLLFCENIFLRMLTGVVCAFGWGAANLIRGGFQIYDMLGTLLMIFITPLAVFLLSPVFSREGERLLFALPFQSDANESSAARYNAFSTLSAALLLFASVFSARAFYISLGFPLLTFNAAHVLAFSITLLFTANLGFVPGIVAAILSGIAANPITVPVLIIASAVFALTAPIISRSAPVLAIIAALVFTRFYSGMEMLLSLAPSAILAIPLLLAYKRVSKLFPTEQPTVVEMNDFTAAVTYELRAEANRARLQSLSSALNSLSCLFYSLSDQLKKPKRADVEKLCKEAFAEKCKGCPKYRDCTVMHGATSKIYEMIDDAGNIDPHVLADQFSQGCGEILSISERINREFASLTQNTYKSEKTEVYADDYSALSMLIRDISNAEREEFKSNRDAANNIYDYLYDMGIDVRGVAVCGSRICRIAVRGDRFERFSDKQEEICSGIERICKTKLSRPSFERDGDVMIMRMHSVPSVDTVFSGSTVNASDTDRSILSRPLTNEYTSSAKYIPSSDCGDHIAIFNTDSEQAYFYAIISDGMGSGKEASFTSGICTVFLEKMLCAGSSTESALRMLNGIIRSKNQSTADECSSTVDLFELDLINGHAIFAKSGAAPTYVVREGTVYKLSSCSVPIGILKDSSPRMLKFRMRPGDVVVMVSDGVTLGNDECPWLIDLLSDTMPSSMDALRLDILRRAIASGSDDDLSAIAIRVEEISDKNEKK